ncbi:MAG TPA: hypothetical protein VHL58_07250 [Thermoanaerobaculia bacterium]|nr:hypothetical protein [Thermoanaerobaculia bacterium]
MKEQCSRQTEIVKALRSASPETSELDHLSDCEGCRDAVAADDFMRQLDVEPLVTHRLPDASLLWLKAQLLQNQESGARLTRRLLVVQYLPLGIVAVLWSVLLSWKWKTVYEGLQHFSFERFVSSSALGSNPLPMSVLLMFAVMLGLTVIVTLQGVFAEE